MMMMMMMTYLPPLPSVDILGVHMPHKSWVHDTTIMTLLVFARWRDASCTILEDVERVESTIIDKMEALINL